MKIIHKELGIVNTYCGLGFGYEKWTAKKWEGVTCLKCLKKRYGYPITKKEKKYLDYALKQRRKS